MVTTRIFKSLLIGMILVSVIVQGADMYYDRSEVTTLGSGEMSVTPDMATIYVSISTQGTTVSEATNNAQQMLSRIDDALNQSQFQNSTIQTSYFSIYPTYNYSLTSNKQTVNGYTVYVSLTITLEGIDMDQSKLGKAIQLLAQTNVSSVSSITYSVMDMETPAVEARKAAFTNALKKAQQYVDITGGSLGKILKIDQSGQTFYPYYTTSSYGYTTQNGLGVTISSSQKALKLPGLQLPQGQVSIIVDVVVTWVLNTTTA